MNQTPKYGSLSSSVDPQKLATSVQGVIKLVSGALVFFGLISTTDANTVIEQVTILIPVAYSAYGSVEIIFGVMRKMVVKFSKQ